MFDLGLRLARRAMLGSLGAVAAAASLLDTRPAGAEDQSGLTAHAFGFTAIDGSDMPLAGFSGKVMLIVNTASRCGFTGQYKGLEELHDRYGDRGLVVIGVPSNDFGQELATDTEVAGFCQTAFGVSFRMARRADLLGSDAHPFYQWTARAMRDGTPRWNFHKILIGRDGRPVGGFGATVDPLDKRLVGAIETALAAPAS